MSGALPDLAVTVVGGGPKGVALLARLAARGLSDVAGFEESMPVGTWDSSSAGTSPTRTGMHFSDTVEPSDSVIADLPTFAKAHPAVDDDMIERDDLPKEVLQEYYRAVVCENGLTVHGTTRIDDVSAEGDHFRCRTADGRIFTTAALVDATGIVWNKAWPAWTASLPDGQFFHSIGHGALRDVDGRRILVVGGGHATPDIAARMSELGADVYVVVRGTRLKPHFLPYSMRYLSEEFQRSYRNRDPLNRYRLLRHAQSQGPWVTPRSYAGMLEIMDDPDRVPGSIALATGTEVVAVHSSSDAIRAFLSSGETHEFDYVICATGFVAGMPRRTAFTWTNVPIESACIGGLPIISDDYELAAQPGAFVIGYLAQLGPRGPIDSILYGSDVATGIVGRAVSARVTERLRARMSLASVGSVNTP